MKNLIPATGSGFQSELTGDRSPDALTGAAGLTFAALVIAQNVIRAATGPTNGASPATVLNFLHQQAWFVHFEFVTYLLGYPAILLFGAGLARAAVAANPRAQVWAQLGRNSLLVVVVLFGLVNAIQVTMLASRDALTGQPDLTAVLWNLHNAVFTLNFTAVGVALFGLGRAAVVAGLIPRWTGPFTAVGGLLLALAAAPAVAEIHGSALMGIGLVGFVIWLAFVAGTGLRLLRSSAHRDPA